MEDKQNNITDLEVYFNINRLLSPSGLAARHLANIISNEKGALFKSYFLNKLEVIKIPILADTSIIGKRIKNLLYLFKKDIKFLACYSKNTIIYSTRHVLKAGDEILLCGKSGVIQKSCIISILKNLKKIRRYTS